MTGSLGIFLKLIQDGVIQVRQPRAGVTVYAIGGETFHSPEAAWKAFAWENSLGQNFEEKEWAKGRTLKDTFASDSFVQKLEAATPAFAAFPNGCRSPGCPMG